MEDNEIHYLTYDPDAIWDAMIDAYLDAGGDVLYPGDEKEMLMRGVQGIIMQAFAGIDNALRMDTLRYAVGEYLDIYGQKRNCYRIQAEKATANVTLTFRATGSPGVIPAGTPLTADGSVIYETAEDIAYTGYAGSQTADIVCTEAGAKGNGLTAGSEMQLLVPPEDDNVTNITVNADAEGGQNEEDDDTYRARIQTYGLAAATTGTSEMYERIAKETSSEIIDARALNEGNLDVYVYLILAAGANPTSIINSVTAALSPKDARPLSDNITVAVATAKTYTLNVSYSGADTTDLATAVSNAVKKYQSWQDEHIGQPFNPDMLKAYMYQAGCTVVTFTSGSEFDGGPAVYTEIDPEECCKGTITVTAVSA